MRRYAVGAMLLDLGDPRHLMANLPEPLITARNHERDGYVPNVVYTCGGLVHRRQLIIPYGFSDHGIGVCRVGLDGLLKALLAHRRDRVATGG